MYCDFLDQIPDLNYNNNEKYKWSNEDITLLQDSLPLLKKSADNWTEISKNMKIYYDNESSNMGYDIEYSLLTELIEDIYDLEKKFFNNIKTIQI